MRDYTFKGEVLKDSFFKRSSALYERLILKVKERHDMDNKAFIIVPDRSLYKLPFEMLIADTVQKDYRDYEYLVRQHEISYMPSAKYLCISRKKVHSQRIYQKDFVAFANPLLNKADAKTSKEDLENPYLTMEATFEELPGSEREVNEISAFFPAEKSEIFVGEEASENTLKKLNQSGELAETRYLHFSTHGRVDYQNPEFSRLFLATDSSVVEDGFLQMFEIFDLKLSCELISLSACDTGLGKILPSEGVMGFSRGFLYAGTPTIVLSLWKVMDESTADFFINYYAKLKESDGRNKYNPLRDAQLAMIESDTYSNPYCWAPFILIGEK